MVSPNVNKIIQEVDALNDRERQELQRLLEERSNITLALTPEQKLHDALVRRGLVEKTPPQGKDLDQHLRWQPIEIQGKPLSETIIEERR